jgi:hypothetical protein
MRVEEACDILTNHLGCGEDIVYYNGVELTPSDIPRKVDRYGDTSSDDAEWFEIEFFAGEKDHKRITGTLAEMVGERMGILRLKGRRLVKAPSKLAEHRRQQKLRAEKRSPSVATLRRRLTTLKRRESRASRGR